MTAFNPSSESNRPKSILLLEDDPAFTALLRDGLEPEFSITAVPSGVEGLKQVMTADFDIILCDMMMPNLPGDMFYTAVERTKPALCKRFIFMTGHRADRKWDDFARKVGGIMLWKPFEFADLMSAIRTVLRKSSAAAGREPASR